MRLDIGLGNNVWLEVEDGGEIGTWSWSQQQASLCKHWRMNKYVLCSRSRARVCGWLKAAMCVTRPVSDSGIRGPTPSIFSRWGHSLSSPKGELEREEEGQTIGMCITRAHILKGRKERNHERLSKRPPGGGSRSRETTCLMRWVQAYTDSTDYGLLSWA